MFGIFIDSAKRRSYYVSNRTSIDLHIKGRERKRGWRINVFRLLLKKAEERLVIQIEMSNHGMLIDIILPIVEKKLLNLQVIIDAQK